MKPGLYPDLSPDDYFAGFTPTPALSNSIMKYLVEETAADAAHAHPQINPDPELRVQNAAMRQGDVTHQLALGKGRGYLVVDAPTFATVAGKEGKAEAEKLGLTPIVKAKFAEAEKMADILRAKIVATLNEIGRQRGLEPPEGGWPYQTEVPMAWVEKTANGPVWCVGMMDVWCESLLVILDPKITPRLSDKRVRGQMEAQGWDRQGYWYERGIAAIFPEYAGRVTFANLLVNPKPPHVDRAVKISRSWRSAIEPEVQRCLETWGHCLSFNRWPGYASEIEELEPTPWKLKAAMEAEFEEDAE